MVRQIGVEGHAVACGERIGPPVAEQDHLAGLDQRGLPAARLVHRRVIGAAGDRPRRERVHGQLGPLAGNRRRQHFGAMAAARVALDAALAGAYDRHRPALVKAQQLREAQLETRRDPRGDLQRRAGLAALDLREHRRADTAAQRQLAQRQSHRLAQRTHARPDRGWVVVIVLGRGRHTRVRYHGQPSAAAAPALTARAPDRPPPPRSPRRV